MNQSCTLDQLFLQARSHNGWLPGDIADAKLRTLYELTCHGPTSANTSPMRLVFVKTAQAKARLVPALAPANVAKVLARP